MILVVASHPATRDTLASLVSAKGYPVTALDCGEEVLKWVRFRSPSLLILDCDLEENFETLAKVRAEKRIAPVPVVMYSESDANLREKALGKGAHAFVPKGSLDWAEIMTEINRFVGPPPATP
jgi:CheY-like chemotaxis protein